MNRIPARFRLAAVLAAVASVAPSLAAAQTLPSKFRTEVIASGFSGSVAVAFLPGGQLLVAEQGGIVWVVDAGITLATPFIDLSDEVGTSGDRGLLGMAVSPDFALTGEVFFLFTVDEIAGDPEPDYDAASWSRLVRYNADLAAGGLVVDPTTRAVLIGNDPSDGIASCSPSHSIGSVRYALDGTLFVGSGDGADFRFTDGGQVPNVVAPTCEDLFPTENIGALRSQNLDILAGKILRIDPATGLGLADNPFWDGDATSVVSRVWAFGLRNPYRFSVRPGTAGPGTVYAGDVGWYTWEELNVVTAGANLGWPCYEGDLGNADYMNDPATQAGCALVPASAVTAPLVPWHHGDPGTLGFTGQTALGGAFYEGTIYPSLYEGALFFGDYSEGWLRVARVDAADGLIQLLDFGTGLNLPVDIEADPSNGDIVYVSIADGDVRRIVYDDPTPGNEPPIARIAATPTSGNAPLLVAFSGAASSDPDMDALTFAWTFSDGGAPLTGSEVMYTFETPGLHMVTLTVTDTAGADNAATRSIQVGSGCHCRAVAGSASRLPPETLLLALMFGALTLARFRGQRRSRSL